MAKEPRYLGDTPDVGFVLHRPAHAGRLGISPVEQVVVDRAYLYGSRTLRLLAEYYPARPNSRRLPRYSLDGLHYCHHLVCVMYGRINEFRYPSGERIHRAMADQIGEVMGHWLDLYNRCRGVR